jgi:hypothetical protein
VGIGVALNDVSSQINAFWRSRPIDGTLWYWIKFVTGLAILLAVLILPPFTVVKLSDLDYYRYFWPARASLAMMLILNPAIYAAAVMMTVLTRHAVYAAILGLGVVVACAGAAAVTWRFLYWADRIENESQAYSFYLIGGLIACFVISTTFAWLATKNDWGLKSRY